MTKSRSFYKGISLLAFSISIAAQATSSFNAKHVGQGFTSLTNDFTASINNPALANKYDDNDDFYFSLGAGILVLDEDDTFDLGENISDDIDQLRDNIREIEDNLPDFTVNEIITNQAQLNLDTASIISDLSLIDEQPIFARVGLNALIMIPNKHLSFGVFVNQYARLAVSVDYDDTDTELLFNAVETLNSDLLDNLSSSGNGLGYSVIEGGVILSKKFIDNEYYTLSLGTKIKTQRIDILSTTVNIDNFDEDEFDLDDDVADSTEINFDLGLYANWGEAKQWHAALVANDLSKHEVSFTNNNELIAFELESNAQAAISYQKSWYRFSAEIDLIDREGLGILEESKYLALGAQFSLGEHAQLRLGARTDFNDVEEDIYTIGLGLSPWDIISFDIAALTGDETLGVALQLGVKL